MTRNDIEENSHLTVHHARLSHVRYRPDIDGLRAVAVLAVVNFHAFPDLMKGGFIGVDIFFVVSGYLISTIIFESVDNGTFSFSRFYARRIKRTFPALILVFIACFTFGWFVLPADGLKQLGEHIASGSIFIDNLVLCGEPGYFDSAARLKPLLHLWSLGIVAQFYVFWPVFLRLSRNCNINFIIFILAITLISFSDNIHEENKDIVLDFYSSQTRFWELTTGGIVAWMMLYRPDISAIPNNIFIALRRSILGGRFEVHASPFSSIVSIFGFSLIIYGLWRIGGDAGFPGKWVLIPVLAAALLIFSGPGAMVNRSILSNKIAVWFGLISFPLYLWHWPLLSFARIVQGEEPNLKIRIAVVLISIALAWCTYRFVERPIRFGNHGKATTVVLVALMAVVGYAGYNAYQRDGQKIGHRSSSSSTIQALVFTRK
ncbi:acyltransferase family protein [Rhizobium leucaenae]|uniref:acyltransferase family protein n=1 Tax=Rhizobium leucaenae TaxID=29450 RepID=UPI00155F58A1|nr:acyltransferase [Rhizobium leucaenae]MBB6305161.1 peptidoglycan/LPS O-acetylase OafA/YrhL [Rhizobium leucaenae]